jgi:hypothetical protein
VRWLLALAGGRACAQPAQADYQPGMPPDIDPGTPNYVGSPTPVPPEPGQFDPAGSRLQAIYDADPVWFDRMLERPTTNNQNLHTVVVDGATLDEVTAVRRQYPSHWSSVHAATGLRVAQRKFITHENVAVTVLTLTNTGAEPTTRTLIVSSPIATMPAALGSELTGTVTARYGLTTITPRLSGDGFAVSGSTLTRTVTLDPGQSTTLKVLLGATTKELPRSDADYERFRGYDPETARAARRGGRRGAGHAVADGARPGGEREADQRLVGAARAAARERCGDRRRAPRAAELPRPRQQRRLHDRAEAVDRRERAAAHRQVQQGTDLHVVDLDAVKTQEEESE